MSLYGHLASSMADQAAAGGVWTMLLDGVILAVVGMGIVFVALVFVGLSMVLLRLAVGERPPAPARPPAAAEAPAAAPAEAGAGEEGGAPSPQTIAVLAAAVAAVVGQPARITRVRFVAPAPGSAWAEHGRKSIQSSHTIRKVVR